METPIESGKKNLNDMFSKIIANQDYVSPKEESEFVAKHLPDQYKKVKFVSTRPLFRLFRFLAFLVVVAIAASLLMACSGESVTLPEGMSAAMMEKANLYDAQFPGNSDMNVAMLCAERPAGLYWNEEYKTWAVVCEMPIKNMYGAVMLDENYKVLNSEHVNAVSLVGLEDLIASVGWVKK